MNSLTKALIEGLIDETESFNGKIVGMFGGGFKPPTIGHLEVVQKALNDYPEMDELIILVGSGVRNSISQEESLAIWDIYKKSLPSKVKIMASPKNKAPIGAIYSYARKNPNERIYWFLGEREGNEGDAEDIVKRTKSLRKLAYQNVKVKKIVTGGAVSGTKARQAVLNKDKEAFFQYIPDIPEKDKIWDMLTGVVEEQFLQERIAYDAETRMQTRFLMKQFLKNLGTRVESDTEGVLVGKEYELVYKFIPSKTNLGFLPFKITGSTGPKDIEIVIQYQPKELTKEYYSELSAEIRNTVRHELEHLAQYRTDKGVKPRGNQDDLPDVEYLTLDYEIPGHIQGLRTKAKAKKISLQQAIEDLFNSAEYDLDLDEEDFVRETWMNWLEKNMPGVSLTKIKEDILQEKDPKKGTGKKPKGSGRRLYTDEDPSDTVKVKFSTRQDIIDTLNKTSFKNKSHARQSQVINLIHQRTRAAYNRAKDPDVKKRLKSALDYITKRKEASKKKTQRLKNQKKKVNEKLTIGNKEVEKINKIGNNPEDWTITYVDGTEEPYLQHLSEGITKEGLTPQILSLTQYMGSNGLDLKPYPKIKFISNDKENAEDLLGRTAYYDPNQRLVALYTMGRHPKDILRSYAHELIHHHQNLSGTLDHSQTTNTNEDGDLDRIEREAYEHGNILFRNWEDQIKNGEK